MGSALRLVALRIEYGNGHAFPLLSDVCLAPNEGDESVEFQQDDAVLSCCNSSFSSSTGRPLGLTAFAFDIAFIAAGISYFVGLIPRVHATGCWGSLIGISGSSMSSSAFRSERNNCTNLLRIRPLFRSSLRSSSRTHSDSTYSVFSSCTDLVFWKNTCWCSMRNCFSSSTTRHSKKHTTAARRPLFSQLHAFLTATRSCESLMSVFRLYHAACIVPVAVCNLACVWASPLQPRFSLLHFGGEITNSAVRIHFSTCPLHTNSGCEKKRRTLIGP